MSYNNFPEGDQKVPNGAVVEKPHGVADFINHLVQILRSVGNRYDQTDAAGDIPLSEAHLTGNAVTQDINIENSDPSNSKV